MAAASVEYSYNAEIYIEDPRSHVQYELEDITDVKDLSVLLLNVDLDEHIDIKFY